MHDDGELDITSDIDSPPRPATPLRGNTDRRRRKSIRILFGCCQLYTRLTVPKRIMTGELKSWRVHCPKCGKLVDISNSP